MSIDEEVNRRRRRLHACTSILAVLLLIAGLTLQIIGHVTDRAQLGQLGHLLAIGGSVVLLLDIVAAPWLYPRRMGR